MASGGLKRWAQLTFPVAIQNALGADAKRRDPRLALHVVIHTLSDGLDLGQDLDAARSTTDQGDSLSRGVETGIIVRRVHQGPLERVEALYFRHLPLVQRANCLDEDIGAVGDDLEEPGQTCTQLTIMASLSPRQCRCT